MTRGDDGGEGETTRHHALRMHRLLGCLSAFLPFFLLYSLLLNSFFCCLVWPPSLFPSLPPYLPRPWRRQSITPTYPTRQEDNKQHVHTCSHAARTSTHKTKQARTSLHPSIARFYLLVPKIPPTFFFFLFLSFFSLPLSSYPSPACGRAAR